MIVLKLLYDILEPVVGSLLPSPFQIQYITICSTYNDVPFPTTIMNLLIFYHERHSCVQHADITSLEKRSRGTVALSLHAGPFYPLAAATQKQLHHGLASHRLCFHLRLSRTKTANISWALNGAGWCTAHRWAGTLLPAQG
jgi:hypothetical protein